MYGAILGDIIGSPYEFDGGEKSKVFPLFVKYSQFTDDSVMTIAVADALMKAKGYSEEYLQNELINSMQKWGRAYPKAGYGRKFFEWLCSSTPLPYNSYGNGSAMRVSSVGWLYDSLEETRHIARITAAVTHNHPEGIKGADCIASVIYLARTGANKEEIRSLVVNEFNYDISNTCNDIRPDYEYDVSCQGTIPPAIVAFLEGVSFEDVIRNAVSLGGDCDTLTCIAGSMAEAYYDVPDTLKNECLSRIDSRMKEVFTRFNNARKQKLFQQFYD